MLIRTCILVVLSATFAESQLVHENQDGVGYFDWGWQLAPQDSQHQRTIGHYYVKLPQSEQRVIYSADETGYHGVTALNTSSDHHTSSAHFALGQQALDLSSRQALPPRYKALNSKQDPVEIFLLHKTQPEPVLLRSNYVNLPHYNNLQPFFNLLNRAKAYNNTNDVKQYDSPVQVFKDANCTKNEELQEAMSYKVHANYKLVTSRPNARLERFYYKQILTTTSKPNRQDGINKLIHSTKDLITSEDLIRINNAAERSSYRDQSDDLIKPRPRLTFRAKAFVNEDTNSQLPNIDATNEFDSEEKYGNEYQLNSPIIVAENNDYRDEATTLRNNIHNKFKVVGLKDSKYDEENYVTKSHISEDYLKPITAAVRLLNSVESETYNDHEPSYSEVTETRKEKENTVVEIQKSIPLSITHINNVETHDYLDFDKHNKPFVKPLQKHRDFKHRKPEDNNNNKGAKSNLREPLQFVEEQQNDNVGEADSSFGQKRSENINFFLNSHQNGFDYEDNNKVIQTNEKQIKENCKEKTVNIPTPVHVPVPIDRPVPIPVPIEKIVEKPVEITKYIEKPYPVEINRPYPLEIKVPFPVEQKIYVDRQVNIPYPVEKVVEKTVVQPVVVPTPVAVPIPIPVEKKVFYPVYGKDVPVPVQKPVQRVNHDISLPVIDRRPSNRYETKVPLPYPSDKKGPVVNPVPVPIHEHHPYTVDRIVPVRIPYPVDKVVDKIIETPMLVNKFLDKTHPIENNREKNYQNDNSLENVPYPLPYGVRGRVKIDDRPIPPQVRQICEAPCVVYSNDYTNLIKDSINQPQRYDGRSHPQYLPRDETQFLSEESRNQHHRDGTRNQLHVEESRNIPQLKESKDPRNHPNHLQNPFNYQEVQYNPSQGRFNNHYATSYQYINGSTKTNKDFKQLPNNFLYVSNLPNYSGLSNDNQQEKKKIKQEDKFFSDRMPKVLKIEYGFKPPLIPSMQVDLNGLPVNEYNN